MTLKAWLELGPQQKPVFFCLVSGKQRDPKKAKKQKGELILGKKVLWLVITPNQGVMDPFLIRIMETSGRYHSGQNQCQDSECQPKSPNLDTALERH